jgi:hypothetical protein
LLWHHQSSAWIVVWLMTGSTRVEALTTTQYYHAASLWRLVAPRQRSVRMQRVILLGILLVSGASLAAQAPLRSRPNLVRLPQPAGWVPFEAVIQHEGVWIGRFRRDGASSTRRELDVGRGGTPDRAAQYSAGDVLRVPPARRMDGAADGAADRQLVPTGGLAADGGEPATRDWLEAVERTGEARRGQRAPALKFVRVLRDHGPEGPEQYMRIRIGAMPLSPFEPAAGAIFTRLREPGGIVALPSAPGVAR